MKEKKLAKQKMANAEHKVRVATAFRGNRETDLELQVGDEVTVLTKVMFFYFYFFYFFSGGGGGVTGGLRTFYSRCYFYCKI